MTRSRERLSGTVKPTILAVWWLITGSYVVDASTGNVGRDLGLGTAAAVCSDRFRTIQILPKDLKATLEADSAAAQD